MDVLSLILVCSMYPDEHLVRAMVDASSQGNQYFVADVATLVTFDKAANQTDARTLVTELEKQGGRPLIGMLGLPPAWVSRGGGSSKVKPDLFDSCTNLRIGTSVLAEFYESCLRTHTSKVPEAAGSASDPSPSKTAGAPTIAERARSQRTAPPEAVRLCALRRFGAEIGFEGYADAVLSYLPRQRLLFAPSGFAVGAAEAPEDSCQCEQPRLRRRLPARAEASREARATGARLSPGGAPILD